MPKASKATVQARVEDILRVLLDGAQPWDVRQYVSEKEAAGEEPWQLADGDAPLSERQIRRYAARAETLIAQSCRTARKKLLRRHLAQRRALFARAVSQGDVRAALAVADSEAKLLDLFPRPEDELRRRLLELEKRLNQAEGTA
jgi:hypothetical protein